MLPWHLLKEGVWLVWPAGHKPHQCLSTRKKKVLRAPVSSFCSTMFIGPPGHQARWGREMDTSQPSLQADRITHREFLYDMTDGWRGCLGDGGPSDRLLLSFVLRIFYSFLSLSCLLRRKVEPHQQVTPPSLCGAHPLAFGSDFQIWEETPMGCSQHLVLPTEPGRCCTDFSQSPLPF